MAKHPAAVALGKLGGSVTSPAKAAASRANGKKGGRPKMDINDEIVALARRERQHAPCFTCGEMPIDCRCDEDGKRYDPSPTDRRR